MKSPLPVNRIEVASLVVAPALMSIGDLMHPRESWDTDVQVEVIAAAATRWFLAHLLLLIGIFLFVPGILLLSRTVALRRPRLGYAGRVLVLMSVAALAGIFVSEMALGAFTAVADRKGAVTLLETFNSRVLVALLPGLLAFFVGTGLLVAPLAKDGGALRWPAVCFGLGALFILGEIIAAQVILSQIGNVLILVAGIGFARVLGKVERAAVATGAT